MSAIDRQTNDTESMERLLDSIKNPSREFTPIPFWFFNDKPDKNKIRQQLEDYTSKGVNGIILHPRIGIPEELPYLSEAFFEVVRWVVEIAAELDMKIVLYDEAMYPSGSAHGEVVARNPKFASRGITLAEKPEGREVLVELPDGKCIVTDFTKGTIRGIHFGEDDGEAGAPMSADILNPEAVESFIHLTHDRYYEALKEYFGNTIIGFFTDEPCALGRNAGAFREWVPGMEQEIPAEGGKLEELEGLFTKTENATTAIYHRLIKKHLRENFYAPLSSWCQEHGIAFMGHPEASDDVEEQLYFQIPGQDLILRRVVPKTGGLQEPDSVQAKLAADIARHLGRRRNVNECFGVCHRNDIPWYFTGEDMKWYIDWLGIRGVNLFVPHAFYYSVEGKRKDERPPDVGPHNIWWSHYHKFSDYIKRLSFLMTDSANGARVAVLCDNNRVPCGEIACLYENQIEFNYLPAALLEECSVHDGRLCIREYKYEVVVDTLGIAASAHKGAEILAQVRVVESAQLLADEVRQSINAKLAEPSEDTKSAEQSENAKSAGAGLAAVIAKQPCPGLRAVHLIKNGRDMYLLSNEEAEVINTEIILPATELTAVDLWKGVWNTAKVKASPEGGHVAITLKPCETLLLVKGKLAAEEDKVISAEQEAASEDWTNRFTLVTKADNQAEYQYLYQTTHVNGLECFEVTGEEMVECYCNGEFAGVSFWNPHQFDIGQKLQEGDNEIKLVVTGNAANIYSDADIFYGLQEK